MTEDAKTETANAETSTTATQVVVVSDYDGYFEGKVRDALQKIVCPYRVVRVSATPYLADAVQFDPRGDEISLKFYSGLRHGYGELDWSIVLGVLSRRRADRPPATIREAGRAGPR